MDGLVESSNSTADAVNATVSAAAIKAATEALMTTLGNDTVVSKEAA